LALRQVEEIQGSMPGLELSIVPIDTQGDKDKLTPLSEVEESDFFTREIEQALLAKEIDLAVHSAKDLPGVIPQGLVIAAITASISPYESLVSRDNLTLEGLSSGSRIATSSLKRKEAIKRFRNDLVTVDIRGNIEERLSQLDQGYFAALILAHAALLRLDLQQRVSQIIPLEIIPAHPLQGSLAIEVRSEDEDLQQLFSALDTRKGAGIR
jgi:hydroxymethylbilane synthase